MSDLVKILPKEFQKQTSIKKKSIAQLSIGNKYVFLRIIKQISDKENNAERKILNSIFYDKAKIGSVKIIPNENLSALEYVKNCLLIIFFEKE